MFGGGGGETLSSVLSVCLCLLKCRSFIYSPDLAVSSIAKGEEPVQFPELLSLNIFCTFHYPSVYGFFLLLLLLLLLFLKGEDKGFIY